MRPLTITLRTVTPLFLGGVEPNDHAELRVASLKGLLRYWYRACDPAYHTWEPRIFGGTGQGDGQACVSLRLAAPIVGDEPWAGEDGRRYTEAPFQEGDRQEPTNGLSYLGYPFRMGSNDRKAIPAGTAIALILRPNRRLDEEDERVRRGLLAAIWLLGHMGSAGSRARRGFGSLRLEQWELGALAEDARQLPLAVEAQSAEQWLVAVERGLGTLRTWFGVFSGTPDHTVLGPGVRLLLYKDGFTKHGSAEAWERALGAVGKELQLFRRRKPDSDYKLVKAHLVEKHLQDERRKAERNGRSRKEIDEARQQFEDKVRVKGRFITGSDSIARAAFGLPLAFRYRSLKPLMARSDVTFEGTERDRSASPLHLRVVQIGERLHPMALVTTAPLLAPGERVGEKRKGQHPDPRHAFALPGRTLLHDFAAHLVTKGALERVLP